MKSRRNGEDRIHHGCKNEKKIVKKERKHPRSWISGGLVNTVVTERITKVPRNSLGEKDTKEKWKGMKFETVVTTKNNSAEELQEPKERTSTRKRTRTSVGR